MRKRVILFDFGAILVGLSKQRCIDALRKIGCGRIAYYVDECRQEDLFHELEIGGSIEAFCEEARRQSSYTDEMGVFHPCKATDEEICWAWNQLLTDIPVEKLRMVKWLHDECGYHTAILSNTNQIHWQYSVEHLFTVDGLTVHDYFDDIFLSCDLGMVKPDDGIYQEMIGDLRKNPSLADLAPSDILFIDDSAKNCAAAESNGIGAYHDPKGDTWQTLFADKAAVIGNFDGVHKGHQYIIERLKDIAAKHGMHPTVITFDRHPRSLFDANFTPEYLTTSEEKNALLESMGVKVVTLPFNQRLADTTARDFMQKILADELNVKLLLLGYDNRFGKRNEYEDFDTYRGYGEEMGIKVMLGDAVDVGSVRVSSSYVRHQVSEGNIEEANRCLGRNYSVTGVVVEGHKVGRKLGFPTANVEPPYGKLMPKDGVYATQILVDGKVYKSITNVGTRPTLDNGSNRTVETNIVGFNEELYGKTVTVSFLRRLRDEIKFNNVEELKAQIEEDRKLL